LQAGMQCWPPKSGIRPMSLMVPKASCATYSRAEPAGTDPHSWPEYSVRALEGVLESGDLDWVEHMLGDEGTARVLRCDSAGHRARVRAVADGLVEARKREAAGGIGSLIDPCHPLTVLRKRTEELRAANAARSRAAA
jgi:hypothetical protein